MNPSSSTAPPAGGVEGSTSQRRYRMFIAGGHCGVKMTAEISCPLVPPGFQGPDTTLIVVVDEKQQKVNAQGRSLEEAPLRPPSFFYQRYRLWHGEEPREHDKLYDEINGELRRHAGRLSDVERFQVHTALCAFVNESVNKADFFDLHGLNVNLKVEVVLVACVPESPPVWFWPPYPMGGFGMFRGGGGWY